MLSSPVFVDSQVKSIPARSCSTRTANGRATILVGTVMIMGVRVYNRAY